VQSLSSTDTGGGTDLVGEKNGRRALTVLDMTEDILQFLETIPEEERIRELDRRGPKGHRAKLSFETRKDMVEQGAGRRTIRMLNLYVRLEHLLRYEYAKLPPTHKREIRRLHRALAHVYMKT
jgi:hypothetical protein